MLMLMTCFSHILLCIFEKIKLIEQKRIIIKVKQNL